MSNLVTDLLLCATNDGAFYERFCLQAFADLCMAKATRPSYAPESGRNWLALADSYLPTFRRTSPDARPSLVERHAFAVALSVYYAEHLAEFDSTALLNLVNPRIAA